MPATPFYCNWCRERIGRYHGVDAPDVPFVPEGAPPHSQSDHLHTGIVARTVDGPIVAYPCPYCGRNNLLQLPRSSEA